MNQAEWGRVRIEETVAKSWGKLIEPSKLLGQPRPDPSTPNMQAYIVGLEVAARCMLLVLSEHSELSIPKEVKL